MHLAGLLHCLLLIGVTYGNKSSRFLTTDSNGQEDTIDTVLKRVSGVYREEAGKAPKYPELKDTVMITGCNHGFLNHLENFKCFADRLNMKFLVIALDKKTHDYLRLNTTMESIFMNTGAGGVGEESATFRSAQFNIITARKKEAVHDVLELGYDVLFTDTDVALIRDPFPYLLWKDVDYVHSLNVICSNEDHWDFRNTPKEEGNTGFYYVKSNPRTIKLWQRAYEAVPKYPGLDDQAVFWRVIRQSTDPEIVPLGVCRDFDPASSDSKGSRLLGEGEEKEGGEKDKDKEAAIPLVTCRLDPCVFSSGMLSRVWIPEYTYEALVDNVALRNETICALHANYLSGNTPKMQRMQEYGFWLASKREMIGLENDGSSKAAHHHHHHAKHHESEDWGGKCSDFVLRKVTTEEHESNQVRRKLRHLSRN